MALNDVKITTHILQVNTDAS